MTNRREFLSLTRPSGATEPGKADEPTNASAAAPESDRILNRFSLGAMGCEFDLLFDAQRFPRGADAAWNALQRIRQLESQLSTYIEESPVSSANRRAAFVPVEVPPEVLDLLDLSAEMYQLTAGAFDITSGPLSKVWGYYNRQPRVPSQDAIDQALRNVGFRHLTWDRAAHTLSIAQPGVEINFASIGKGFALDDSADLLLAAGVDEFLLQGGQSSVVARRPTPCETGWTIGVLHPLVLGWRLGTVELRNQALATSGSQRQALIHRGQRLGHILDPRTGWPATHTLSATVVSPSAAEADALATAFCLLTFDQIASICSERRHLGVLLVRTDPENEGQLILDIINEPQLRWAPTRVDSCLRRNDSGVQE